MTIGKPRATYSEDEYRFHWPDIEGASVEMVLERFTETRDGDIRCECKITYSDALQSGTAYSGRLLLVGPNSLRDVVNSANKLVDWPYWAPVVSQARDDAKDRFRTGEPPTDLRVDMGEQPAKYLVRPFIPDRGITVMYGSEESAKSMTVNMLAVAVSSGREVAGLVSEEIGPVGYLDWEDDAVTARERMLAICSGAGIDPQLCHIEHKRMAASLDESKREIKQWLGKIHARLVIVDSLGMACGGDPNDPSLMIKAMIAARSLDLPVVAIHHLAKEAKDKTRPYGTVYAAAEARMTWLVEKEDSQKQENGKLRIALTNMKSNRSRRHPRQSFEYTFDVDEDTEALRSVSVRPLAFRDTTDVGTGAGQKWRIADALKARPLSVDAIAEQTRISKASVRTQLNRHGGMFVKIDEENWALAARPDEAELVSNEAADPW